MATVPRLRQYYEGATTSCPRMSFGLLVSPAGSRVPAGVRVRTGALPSPYRPGDGPGSGFSCWQSPFQPLCPRARAGSPRFPGDPSRDFAPIHDPGRPVAPHQSRRFRCCPPHLTMKASSFTDFEAARRFVTCCLRFTTGRYRTPCKTRFRLAGCAFAGRESNPLDRYEEVSSHLTSPSPGLSLAQ